ncbi:hypothetical protein CTB58_003406 [Vibrio mimicus]
MNQQSSNKLQKDRLRKALLWLIILDYILLAFFLAQLSSLTLNNGTIISLLLFVYNIQLFSLCFQNTNHRDSYIIYPTISATLLAFVYFLYFFFMV